MREIVLSFLSEIVWPHLLVYILRPSCNFFPANFKLLFFFKADYYSRKKGMESRRSCGNKVKKVKKV